MKYLAGGCKTIDRVPGTTSIYSFAGVPKKLGEFLMIFYICIMKNVQIKKNAFHLTYNPSAAA